jgi:hypothetical protein
MQKHQQKQCMARNGLKLINFLTNNQKSNGIKS